MRNMMVATIIGLVVHVSPALAQQPSFLSVPSSAFTPRAVTGNHGYGGNTSGTARTFDNSFRMFAPVVLPHGATVTAFRCGGMAPSRKVKLVFSLRRNQPQVANIDMATVMTTFAGLGFQHPDTTSIASPVINNRDFNYYIIAETRHIDVGLCPKCVIGYCTIRYTR